MAKRISRPKAAPTTPGGADGPLQAVFSSNSIPESYIVRGVLEDGGIECALSNELIATVDSPLSFITGGVQVLVRASDADRARQILRDQQPISESA